MAKLKKTILFIIMAMVICLIPNIVEAADTFTTSDGIVVKKTTTDTSGTLLFSITNIKLSEEKEYKWGIATSKDVTNVAEWYMLNGDPTAKTANFMLTSTNSKILKILKSTDIAYIYIKENNTENYIINGLKIDLKINPENALKIEDSYGYRLYYIYGISISGYKFVKSSEGKTQPVVFNAVDQRYTSYSKINKDKIPTEEGTYYLWVEATDSGTKNVYAYATITVDGSGPQVSSIKVESPVSGTYKTTQTVKIRVYFNETITGTTVPTLKIKFGTSPERAVTNGTIKSNYVEYSYNIQATDVGQLATVDLSGGTIKDINGNDAKLSCPIISGNTIKANMEGNTTNNTQNQDTTNNGSTTDNIEWTDFSKAKFEIKYDDTGKPIQYIIKNFTWNVSSTYYIYYTKTTDKPTGSGKTISGKNEFTIYKDLDEVFEENNKKIYIWIEEEARVNGEKIKKFVKSAWEIDRPILQPLGARMKFYFFNDRTSAFLYTPSLNEEKRNVNIKIGKVTDNTILLNIKNKKAGAMDALLKYAKDSKSAMYTGTIKFGDETPIAKNLNLVDDAYYYVYAELQDENGKYYPVEDVSLYQALVSESIGKNLCDYLDSKFKWNIAEYSNTTTTKPSTTITNVTTNKDTTVSTQKLPAAGKNAIILMTITGIIGMGVFALKKNKEYKDIK